MEPVPCVNYQSLQRRLRALQAENERLRRQLDEATRAAKRQAAPLRQGPARGPAQETRPQAPQGLRKQGSPPAASALIDPRTAASTSRPLPVIGPGLGRPPEPATRSTRAGDPSHYSQNSQKNPARLAGQRYGLPKPVGGRPGPAFVHP